MATLRDRLLTFSSKMTASLPSDLAIVKATPSQLISSGGGSVRSTLSPTKTGREEYLLRESTPSGRYESVRSFEILHAGVAPYEIILSEPAGHRGDSRCLC